MVDMSGVMRRPKFVVARPLFFPFPLGWLGALALV